MGKVASMDRKYFNVEIVYGSFASTINFTKRYLPSLRVAKLALLKHIGGCTELDRYAYYEDWFDVTAELLPITSSVPRPKPTV